MFDQIYFIERNKMYWSEVAGKWIDLPNMDDVSLAFESYPPKIFASLSEARKYAKEEFDLKGCQIICFVYEKTLEFRGE